MADTKGGGGVPWGTIAALLPGLGQLFGVGRPNLPSYSPQQIQALISQFYSQLANSSIGQGMFNQANLGANQYQNSLASSLAKSGMNSSVLGNIAGAGASGLGATGRMQVSNDLLNRAQGLTQDAIQGQYNTGAFNALHPSGLTAFLGSLGTSAYPLLMRKNNGGMGGGMTYSQPDNYNWNGNYGAGGGGAGAAAYFSNPMGTNP